MTVLLQQQYQPRNCNVSRDPEESKRKRSRDDEGMGRNDGLPSNGSTIRPESKRSIGKLLLEYASDLSLLESIDIDLGREDCPGL
jgi:hypothetical protein